MSQPPKGQDPTEKEAPTAREDLNTIVTQGPPALEERCGPDPLVGSVVLNYKITKRLAEGGMGVVYCAEHVSIGKPAAIKIIKAEYCQNEVTMRRFLQEGRLVNQTRHPNIIDIFDFGSLPDGRAFYVMELLEGESLARRVGRSLIPPKEALPMMLQAAEALKAAHIAGIVHRDLKPENLFLAIDEGAQKIKLLDFGIAKLVGLDEIQDKLTKTGNIIGTPHYMSPEQVNGTNIDARSDIYSLGMVFYEMLSGQVPFGQRPVGQILAAQILGDTGEISQNLHILTIPEGFKSMVKKAIATHPEDRYQSMESLLEDLEALAKGREIAAPPPKPVAKAARPAAPARAIAGWVVSGVLAALLSAVGAWWILSRPEPAKAVITPATQEVALTIDALRAASLELLRQQLRASGPSVRASAARALGEVNDSESRSRLEALLGASEDIEVRANAALALASLGEKSALPALNASRKEATSYVAVALDAALFALGGATIEGLLTALKGSPEEINIAAKTIASYAPPGEAAAALTALDVSSLKPLEQFELLAERARLGDNQSREALQQKLSSKEPAEQILAAYALARVGSDLGRENLQAGLTTPQAELAILAASSLLYFGDSAGLALLQQSLTSKAPLLRKKATEGIALTQDEALAKSLAPLLRDEDPQVQIAAALAILSIVGLGESWLAGQSIAWAEQATTSSDVKARARGFLALGRAPAARALPILLKAFPDPEKSVNLAIISAVSRIAAEQQSEPAREFLGGLKTQQDSGLRVAGLVGLSKLDAQARAELTALLADTSAKTDEERAAAVSIAEQQGDLETLLAALRDKVFTIKFEAALALARRSDPAGLSALQEGAKSKDPLTSTLARAALAQLGQPTESPPEAAQLLASKDPRARIAGVELAALLPDKERQEALRKAARDEDPEVRLKAAEVSLRAGDPSLAKQALKDQDPSVRAAAALLLQQPTTPASAPASARTAPSSAPAACGNALVEEGEVCDDGNTQSGDGCKADCKKLERCGDKRVDEGEDCDDGNTKNEDGCSESCKEEGVSLPERIRKANEAMLEGKAAFEVGKYAKARGLFKQADGLYKQGDIQWWYAECDRLIANSNTDKSKKDSLMKQALSGYQKFLKAKPGDARAARAKGYISEIQERLED